MTAAQLLTQWKALILSIATIAASLNQSIPISLSSNNTISPNISSSSGVSRNWAGYESSTGSFTSVTGTWSIPKATGTGHTSADAEWVGIGGITSQDLIQSGTQNIISPNGQVSTSAFYEILPNGSQTIPLAVNQGDSIMATISQISSGQWQINIKDNTTGGTYSTSVAYSSSLSSAEWIVEAPSNGNSILPLDNFGTISFSGSSATQNGNSINISQSNGDEIVMANNQDQDIATTSGLGSDNASFSVTRTSAMSSSPIPQFDRNPGSWRRHGMGIGSYTPFTGHKNYNWVTPTPNPAVTQAPTSTYPNQPHWQRRYFIRQSSGSGYMHIRSFNY